MAPTVTLTRSGGRKGSSAFYKTLDTNYVAILVGGHVSSFPCNPEDLLEATSEAAEIHPELELPKWD